MGTGLQLEFQMAVLLVFLLEGLFPLVSVQDGNGPVLRERSQHPAEHAPTLGFSSKQPVFIYFLSLNWEKFLSHERQIQESLVGQAAGCSVANNLP